jgi:hypothetical protein
MEEMEPSYNVMYDFTDYVEEERRAVKGKRRIMNADFDWLKKGDIIELLDINATQVRIKSLNTGNIAWLWRMEVTTLSDRIIGGV